MICAIFECYVQNAKLIRIYDESSKRIMLDREEALNTRKEFTNYGRERGIGFNPNGGIK